MKARSQGDEAPGFELPNPEGRLIRFEPRGPGYKFLVFYKNSCPTCQLAMPVFDRLANAARKSVCYAISQDSAAEARDFAATFGISMPQLVDARPHPVSVLYGFMTVPTSMVVDERGRIELFAPAFVKSQLLEATALLAPGTDPAELYAPLEQLPDLKPG